MFEKVKIKGEQLWKDSETEDLFRGFRGAFAWPGKLLPGFVCVLGERHKSDILRVVFEKHYNNIDELAKLLSTLERSYGIDYWLANKEGSAKGFELLLDDVVACQDREVFLLSQPKFADDLKLALFSLKHQFTQNALVIPKNGILQTKLEQLDQSDLNEADLIEKFPEIMTLAGVVFEFDSLSDRRERDKPKDAWQKEFESSAESDSWMAR
jgi:hypothetical protein